MRRGGRRRREVLDGEEEARLAFIGATPRWPSRGPPGGVAVVDVGGGSTEIVAGTLADGVSWWASFPLGSGVLADRHLRSDPPTADELAASRARSTPLSAASSRPPRRAVLAVGGSAASLPPRRRRLAPETVARVLSVLCRARRPRPRADSSLPASACGCCRPGLLALGAAGSRSGSPLRIGNGGLREGILLHPCQA